MTVDEAAAHELADHDCGAAGALQVLGHVPAAGREACKDGRALADRSELVECERDTRLARDREQVEDSVRRAAGSRDSRHRVQKSPLVEERARRLLERYRERAGALGGSTF